MSNYAKSFSLSTNAAGRLQFSWQNGTDPVATTLVQIVQVTSTPVRLYSWSKVSVKRQSNQITLYTNDVGEIGLTGPSPYINLDVVSGNTYLSIPDSVGFNFGTDNFIWIDFGIRHVFNCSDDDFIQTVEALNNKKYDNFVRIGTIWNLNHVYCLDIYKDISWYFAGGVFGGNIESLLLFSNKMEEQCLKIILEEKTLMWEVNIWYLIYKENNELFFPYLCDHNNTILIHY